MEEESTFQDDPVEFIAEHDIQFGTDLTEDANRMAANTNRCYFRAHSGFLQAVDASGDDTIEAYWCPYHKDDGTPIMLAVGEDSPRFMFTAKMNGCTFDVAPASEDGAVRVVHVNQDKAGFGATSTVMAMRLQKQAQHQLSHEKLEDVPEYGVDTSVGEQVRIVGRRDGNKWTFWKIDHNNVVKQLGQRQYEQHADVNPGGKKKRDKCAVM